MEHLLTLALNNLSSPTPKHIRKGLRQIESLLVQICLSPAANNKQRANFGSTPKQHDTTPSPLESLTTDPAFLEFFRLQQTFEYNITSKLLASLSTLVATQTQQRTAEVVDLTTSLLQTLHGLLLLHPPSRSLLAQEGQIILLLDLLDPSIHPTGTITGALLVILTSLIEQSANARALEAVDGLPCIANLTSNESGANGEIRALAHEVLQFYLLPEAGPQLVMQTRTRQSSCASAFESPIGGVLLPLPMPLQHQQQSPTRVSSRLSSQERPQSPTPARRRDASMSPAKQRSPSKLSYSTSSTLRSNGSAGSGLSYVGSGQGQMTRMTRTAQEKRALLSAFVEYGVDGGVLPVHV